MPLHHSSFPAQLWCGTGVRSSRPPHDIRYVYLIVFLKFSIILAAVNVNNKTQHILFLFCFLMFTFL